jgi:hypothetical protein
MVFCFIAVLGWFVIFGQSYFFGVRYYLHMLPYFLLCMAFCLMVILRSRKILGVFLIIAIVVAGSCSYGLNYSTHDYDQGSVRSLEYRSAVRLHQNLVLRMEAYPSNLTVVAPLIFAQALGLEELGYASKKNNVAIYFWPSKDPRIKELKGSDVDNRDQLIWVEFEKKGGSSLIDPLFDKILNRIVYGRQEVRIFTGGIRVFYMMERARPLIEALERKNK